MRSSACHRRHIPVEALGKGLNIRILQQSRRGAKLLFCTTCGRHTQSNVGLAEACQRQPGSSQQKAKLVKLCAGKHPKTGAHLEDITPAGSGVFRFHGGAPAKAAGVPEDGVDLNRAIYDQQEYIAECYALGGVADGPPDGDHGDPFE